MNSTRIHRSPRFRSIRLASLVLGLVLVVAAPLSAPAQTCPEEPPLQNFTGGGTVVCPCFIPGERAGAVLTAPAEHYPIEILRVGIGWGSQFGGAPQSLEQSVLIYGAGLPNPGAPIASLDGPVLTDGFLNEFDFEPLPGEVVVDSGAFTVALEFLNSNAGDIFAPSVVHDGNGCQSGKNAVYAIPGGWANACALGVTGDWVMYAIYRQVDCVSTGVEEVVTSGGATIFFGAQPNPFRDQTRLDFVLARESNVEIAVYDVSGRMVATLADETFAPGRHSVPWSATGLSGTPLNSGVYFAVVRAGDFRATKKVVLSR